MDLRNLRRREETPAAQAEQLLESYYDRLMKWAMILARGDGGKAEEIVQEFCLYITLTRPDLRAVNNLEGYFYTCLRNLYQSSLARSSREAMQYISTAEFETIRFALARDHGRDLLDRQNELRRICSYVVWRKDQSKSFSYFILHFFHGYHRHEVAEIGGVPMAAIYNKIKTARVEVKAYLEDSGKLRIAGKESPPQPKLLWKQVSPAELFRELRRTVLDARMGPCLPEEELLAHYKGPSSNPLPCSVLSHLVSCEKCLSIVDGRSGRPTLNDREPLDIVGPSEEQTRSQASSTLRSRAMLRGVHERWSSIYEHRPSSLSIAVDGKIIALHGIDGARSILAARVEQPENARFIEVFSEQDVRFALLSIDGGPPNGPDAITQRVELSDDRWLELNLTFDGQGLSSQVSYYDPVLAMETIEEEASEEGTLFALPTQQLPNDTAEESGVVQSVNDPSPFRNLLRRFGSLIPSSAMTWALVLIAALGGTGYLGYRFFHRPITAAKLLHQSIGLEAAALQGKTEHQVIQIEEVAANGKIQQGTVELWRDGGGGRYLRRLYNAKHQAIAAEWRSGKTEHFAYAHGKQAALHDIPWKQSLSARAFSEMGGTNLRLHVAGSEFEVSVNGPTAGYPHLIYATLVLNHRLQPVREIMHFYGGGGNYQVRFIQTVFECVPSRSVPDSTFQPGDRFTLSDGSLRGHASLTQKGQTMLNQKLRLAELQIGVLYQLSQMGIDADRPIAISHTYDGHIRVLGTIADDVQKKHLIARLEALPDHRLLEINLGSQQEEQLNHLRSLRRLSETSQTYEAGSTKPPADQLVRKYLERRRLSGTHLDKAAVRFSGNALELAQQALQNAFALDRLGGIFANEQLSAIAPSSQRQWTAMVAEHASSLNSQMQALNRRLAQILPANKEHANKAMTVGSIDTAVEFARSAHSLLHQVQGVNHNIGRAFAAGNVQKQDKDVAALLSSTQDALPLQEVKEIAAMANRLSASEVALPAQTRKQPEKQKSLFHHGEASVHGS